MDTAPLPTLLRTITRDPGRPRLTWYGPGGERAELSGHVLDNWVTKTTNLLVEEHDAGPGTRVRVDLPPHWRAVVWVLAAWRTGAEVLVDGADADAAVDVAVTHRPEEVVRAGRAAVVLGVALPSLARALPAPPPPGADDATSAALAHPDALGWVPPTDPAAPALTTPARTVPHGDLPAWWRAAATSTPAARLLVTTTDDAVADVLAHSLAALADDGSVVLCDPTTTAALGADPDRRARLVASEQVTAEVSSGPAPNPPATS